MSDGPWWVEPAATMAGIVVAASMVVWQQREASRADLKLKLFEELRKGLDDAAKAITAAGTYAFSAMSNVQLHRTRLGQGQPAAPPISRIPEFIKLHGEAMNRLVAVTYLLEGHDVVSAHFELFRRALGCAHHDAYHAFTPAVQSMYGVLPVDNPNGGTFTPQAEVPAVVNFNNKCKAYWMQMATAGCYIHDVGVEAQNLLLRGLFARQVAARRPIDPKMWVLRTDDPEYLCRLRRFFFEEHPASAQKREIEAEAGRIGSDLTAEAPAPSINMGTLE